VICEGSCDTEDWSNDDKLHFTVYSNREQMIYINNIPLFYCKRSFEQKRLSETLKKLTEFRGGI